MNKWRLLLSKIYRFFFPIDLVTMYKKMGVRIGERCKFQFDVVIDHSHYWLIDIGNDVTLAPRVHILSHDASTKTHLGYTKIAPVKIGNRVFIGAGSIVLPGVTIGDDVIIGAGSVVTKSIATGTVASGNPAKPLGSTNDFLQKHTEIMKQSVLYGEEFTTRGGITETKMNEMRSQLNKPETGAYVV